MKNKKITIFYNPKQMRNMLFNSIVKIADKIMKIYHIRYENVWNVIKWK
jgi:hypothetical protein